MKYIVLIILALPIFPLICMEKGWELIPRENEERLVAQKLSDAQAEQLAAQKLADYDVIVRNAKAKNVLAEDQYTYLHKRIKSGKCFVKGHSLNSEQWDTRLNSIQQSIECRIPVEKKDNVEEKENSTDIENKKNKIEAKKKQRLFDYFNKKN